MCILSFRCEPLFNIFNIFTTSRTFAIENFCFCFKIRKFLKALRNVVQQLCLEIANGSWIIKIVEESCLVVSAIGLFGMGVLPVVGVEGAEARVGVWAA